MLDRNPRNLLARQAPSDPFGAPAPSWREVSAHLEAFEEARSQDGRVDLADYLPPPAAAIYLAVLTELIRIDLEYGWQRGRPRPLADYLTRFPSLRADPTRLSEVSFEEFRLRRQAGIAVEPAEYTQCFGVRTDHWPDILPPSSPAFSPLLPSDFSDSKSLPTSESPGTSSPGEDEPSRHLLDHLLASFGSDCEEAEVRRALQEAGPGWANRLSQALTSYPEVGQEFLGFDLLEVLGTGAFARVFLARQRALAGRLVALKVSTDLMGEPFALAQLHHDNIMPIYSLHQAPPFQAVCMPFLGATTLADILRDLRARAAPAASGTAFSKTISVRRRDHDRSRPSTVRCRNRLPDEVDAPSSSADAEPAAALRRLDRMSYVSAVVWLAVRLADGLAHAHEHGIVHRDLKPANILLSDDGTPMLLDFNLARDTKLRDQALAASIAGTLPYLTPECLRRLGQGEAPSDPGVDLYAFGVILFELLTGQHPYPVNRQVPTAEFLDRLIAERERGVPSLRTLNPHVPRPVEAIVQRCLAPSPADRFASATELCDALRQVLEGRPSAEPAPPARRGRMLATLLPLAAVVLALLCWGLSPLMRRGPESETGPRATLDPSRAWQEAHRLHQEAACAALLTRSGVEYNRRLGQNACRRLLQPLAGDGLNTWLTGSWLSTLPADAQAAARGAVGDLLWLLAQEPLVDAAAPPPEDGRHEALRQALQWNQLAEAAYPPGEVPPALWAQRADLSRRSSLAEEADRWQAVAERSPLRTARDHLLLAIREEDVGHPGRSRKALDEATRRPLSSPLAWFLLARAQERSGQVTAALTSYATCMALVPVSPWPAFRRGLVGLQQLDHAGAAADFTVAIALDPASPEPFLHRALAYHALDQRAESLADLTQADTIGGPQLRARLLRARLLAERGDTTAAQCERTAAFKLQPRDEADWLARARAARDDAPQRALADLDAVLVGSPRSVAALEARAALLEEAMHQPEAALQGLDTLLDIYPDNVPGLCHRGLVLARLGRAEEAHRDGHAALALDSSCAVLYQVGVIHLLASPDQAHHRSEAIRLITAALAKGYPRDRAAQDPDLVPIRNAVPVRLPRTHP